jgi:hypothetical protein
MNTRLNAVLEAIAEAYKLNIQKGSRHYAEVSIGKQAEKMGYPDLGEKYKKAYAIVPLRSPQQGMKVRIDGRTFVNYAQYASGISVPDFIARESGWPFEGFVPQNSMICNF